MDPNYRDWIGEELASSDGWKARVDQRRSEALKPRRTASGYSIASYPSPEEMNKVLDAWRKVPRAERPGAWSEDRVVAYSPGQAPNEPLEHIRRYLIGLAQDEKSWIGATAAPELHILYSSASGYVPNLPSVMALYPAPSGGQASLAAAKIAGADFGTSAARSQAFYRLSPRHPEQEPFFLSNENFTVTLKPVP